MQIHVPAHVVRNRCGCIRNQLAVLDPDICIADAEGCAIAKAVPANGSALAACNHAGLASPFIGIVQLDLIGPAVCSTGTNQSMISAVEISIVSQIEIAIGALPTVGTVNFTADADHFSCAQSLSVDRAQHCLGSVFLLTGPGQVQLATVYKEVGIEHSFALFNSDDRASFAITNPANANCPATVAGFAPCIANSAIEAQADRIQNFAFTGKGHDILNALFTQSTAL